MKMCTHKFIALDAGDSDIIGGLIASRLASSLERDYRKGICQSLLEEGTHSLPLVTRAHTAHTYTLPHAQLKCRQIKKTSRIG